MVTISILPRNPREARIAAKDREKEGCNDRSGDNGSADSVTDAVTIAVAVGSALSTVWGYYITVLVGLAAAIGALAAIDHHTSFNVKLVITIAVLIFMSVNLHSLYSLINDLNNVINYIFIP
jgi:hypothetical protein